MDEIVYRRILSEVHPSSCPFEKSILTNCVSCSKANKLNIAEREIVICGHADSLVHCTEYRDSLRHNFIFALGVTHIDAPMPHAMEMRMQCGGLKGLQTVLDGNYEVNDVCDLIMRARGRFGLLTDLPYVQIVQFANLYYKSRQH